MPDLSAVLDELYGGDPDRFIERRKELAGQARTAKDRPLAQQIAGLRRPTRSAWMVNRLARLRGAELGQLVELGPALSQAHTAGSMAELRQLSALRRQALDALIRLARDLAREAGHEPTQPTLTEVHTILDAALTNPEVGQAVAAGVLTKAPESAASFPTDLFAPLADVITLHPRRTGPDTTNATAATEKNAAEQAEAEAQAERRRVQQRAVAHAQAAVTQATREHTEAQSGADKAHRAARSAAEAVQRLESELDRARAQAATAAERLERAEEAVRVAAAGVSEAENRLAELE